MKSLLRFTLAAAVAAVLCAGSAGAQEKQPAQPAAGLNAREKAAVEKFMALKVGQVKQSIKRCDFDYAIRLIDAILLVAPDTRHARELKNLRIKASQEKLQQEVVRIYLYCAGAVHPIGEKVEVKLRIKNISSGKITLPLSSEEPRNFGVIIKKSCDFELSGSTRMRRTQLTVKQDSPIVLDKNQVWEKTFTIDTSQIEARKPVMRRHSLQAVMRPIEIVTADKSYSRYLATGELELFIMPSEYMHLTKDAMGHLKEATSYIRGKPIPGELAIDETSTAKAALFYSTFFLGGPEKKEAARELIETLEKCSGDTARVIMGSLSYLTKEPFGSSRQDWLGWWEKQSDK